MTIKGARLERGAVLGGYRIEEQIGAGGFGIVYRATNVALNRIYALKVLAPELAADEQFRARFQREMRIAASLDHAHVVGIHYAGEHDGFLFLAMDYVHGEDLRQVLLRDGALDPDRAVALLSQIAAALDAAHAKGLVHRDIKPANMLLTIRDGEELAYLTDFGLAKRSDTLAELTVTGSVVGTADYMSPEQVTGGPTDARSDIYALGCVFFQMLTGKVPYERETTLATMFAHVNEPPPPLESPLADEFPEFTPVLERALAKPPEDRYLSAGDLARDATAALSGARYGGAPSMVATGDARPSSANEPAAPESASATPPPESPATPPPGPAGPGPPSPGQDGGRGGSRRWLWAGVGAAVVAAAIVVAVVLLTSGGSTSGPGQLFEAVLRPVPDNHVTASGTAAVVLHGDTATVTVDATGLLNHASHQMHIHAFGEGICPPPSAGRLYNGHLAISTTDGLKYYGPMAAALTLSGDTSMASMLAFSRYPTTGTIHYNRTIVISTAAANAIRNGNAVVVIHGIDYDHSGHYDMVLNRSELDSAVSQDATAPALCGTLLNPSTVGETG
ncbi:MAG TPA: serine/threonine-protein kinase [Solirubrobacteraceae bacterium]|nr:serine/threonine-protein kinase [Solirubrobacteraceae bacterium]